MLSNSSSLRYFLELSYLGTPFHGWQRQPNAISVQETIEDCLSKILGTETRIIGAGRTDTGVHARQMFAHFDSEVEVDPDRLCYRLDRFLKDDIHCKRIFAVDTQTHARYTATYREYAYYISLGKDPFRQDSAWLYPGDLDLEKLNKGAAILKEYTDFECFSKVQTDVRHFDCTLIRSEWEQNGHVLCYRVRADRFLRNMVRAIVGTLVMMGSGKIDEAELRRIMNSGDRSMAGESAPAQGLFLMEVGYPKGVLK
jgi:tRNA pseudouridine38-40 synthase